MTTNYKCDHCSDMRTSEHECGANQPENDRNTHYICTKDKGHDGDHVACGGGPFEECHNFATWDNNIRQDIVDRIEVIRQYLIIHLMPHRATKEEINLYLLGMNDHEEPDWILDMSLEERTDDFKLYQYHTTAKELKAPQ